MADIFDEIASEASLDNGVDIFDQIANNAEPTPLTAGEAVAGGFGKMLNTLTFGLGDEITAAGAAALDRSMGGGRQYSDVYDEKLNQAREIDRRYNQQNPTASAILSIGSGLFTPMPKGYFSSTPGVKEATKNIGKGALLGAGFGTAAGFGSGEGDVYKRLDNAYEGGKLGALFGGALTTAGEAIQGGARAAKKAGTAIYDIFSTPDIQDEAQLVAKRTLGEYTDLETLPTRIRAIKDTEFTPNMTVGEQIDDAGMGLLLKSKETDPFVNARKLELDKARYSTRRQLFDEAQGKISSDEQAGSLLQDVLTSNKEKAASGVSAAYKAANQEGPLVYIKNAKDKAIQAVLDEEGRGRAIDPATKSLIERFVSLPDDLSIEQLQAQRQVVGELIGDIRSSNPSIEQKAGSRVLARLFGGIDDAEKSAINSGDLTPSQGELLSTARSTAAKKGKTFDSGAVGDITKPGRFSDEFKMRASNVLNRATRTPEDARQVVMALGEDAAAKQALSSSVMGEIPRDFNQNFSINSYRKSWERIKPVANEILSPEQIGAIEKVQSDLSGEARFAQDVANATKRQSMTYQMTGNAAFAKDFVMKSIYDRLPLIGKIFKGASEGRARQLESAVDQILTEMSFNKKYLIDILEKPNDTSIKSLSDGVFEALQNRFKNLPLNPTGIIPEQQVIMDEKKESYPSVLNQQMAMDQIKSDPYYHALAMTESSMNPKAANPNSSAKGLFQFVDATAKSLGVNDPYDINQSFDAVKRLTSDHAKRFGNDPITLYAAHYLGASLLSKVINKQALSKREEEIVQGFYQKALPNFERNLSQVIKV